jgi:ParB family chromosome partitioning protein
MSKNRSGSRRLGKGLDALIRDTQLNSNAPESSPEVENFTDIPVEKIKPNPYQPRQLFSEESLEELASSIRENGLIQPVTVRRVETGYELVAGERRWRAAQLLKLETIPAYIIEVSGKEEMLEMAIIENVQRDELNPVELAMSYQRLIDECRLTQDQVAQKIGKDRSTITNILRLLKLEEYIKESLRNEEISMGHARALLAVEKEEARKKLWEKTIKERWSVRKLEQEIKKSARKKNESGASKNVVQKTVFHRRAEDKFREVFGTQVRLYPKKKGGSVEIEYYSAEDLDRILEIIDSFDY